VLTFAKRVQKGARNAGEEEAEIPGKVAQLRRENVADACGGRIRGKNNVSERWWGVFTGEV